MAAKTKYPRTMLKMLLYKTKLDHPNKELNPYNLSQLTEVPLHIWRDRMKHEIDLINDKEYLDDHGVIKNVESLPFPVVNYLNQFNKLIEKNDTKGLYNLAREATITHIQLLNNYRTLKIQTNSTPNIENQQKQISQIKDSYEKTITELKKKLEIQTDRADKAEERYNILSIRALKKSHSEKNVVHMKPLSENKGSKLTDKL